MRVEERREEVEALLVELQHAGEVDLQHENRNVVRRQRHAQDAEDGGVAGRDLDDDAEREADQRRLAPADLRHGADEECSILWREDGAQVADDARRIRNDVLREHDALNGVGADAVHQRLEQHGAVQPEQPAHCQQREAEAELDARAEVGGQMMMSSEKPLEPSGILVEMSPMAATERKSAISSCSAPAYSPRSGSM